jgi:phosphatidate phosphatase LPIN
VTLPDVGPPSPALSARSDTSNQSTFQRLRNFSLGRQSGQQYTTLPRFPVDKIDSQTRGSQDHLRRFASQESMNGRSLSSFAEASGNGNGRPAMKRLSQEGIPGSLDSNYGHYVEEEGENDSEEEMDDEGDDERDEVDYDDDEAVAEAFDEDLLATGEMENVPFL